jgi:glutamine synthetase
MANPPTNKQVLQNLAAANTEKVKLAVIDIDGVLRGKVVSFEKFVSAVEKDIGFCDVVFGWDAADAAYDNAAVTGWHTGYPDSMATIDLQTFRQIPWENDLPFFLADFSNDKNNLAAVCPRTLLKKLRQQAVKAGYIPYFSQEFEWFNFIDNREELYKNNFRNPQPMTPGMFGYSVLRASQEGSYFHDLFDSL